MASLISKKYSEALFLVGNERNVLPQLCDEIKEVKEIFEKEKTIMVSLSHPKLPLNVKQNIIVQMFDGKVRKEIVGVLNIMLRKSRQEHIMDMFDSFIERCLESQNKVNATLSLADEVDDEAVRRIKECIEKSINKELTMDVKVDKTLIAGYKVKVGDLLFDGTVDGKIKDLKKAIS